MVYERVATGIVSSLKTQPILLVIVVLNFTMIGAVGWFLRDVEQNRHDTIGEILEYCMGLPKPGPR